MDKYKEYMGNCYWFISGMVIPKSITVDYNLFTKEASDEDEKK